MRISAKAVRIVLAGSALAGSALATSAGCEVGYREHRDRGFVEVGPAPAPPPVVVQSPPPGAVVVEQAPPPDIVEQPVGVAPGVDYVWVGGFYDWDGGRYVWRPGHWERPPFRGAHYDRDHWERGPRGYFMVRGGWH